MLHCAEKRTFAQSIIYTFIMKQFADERSLRQHPVKDNEVKEEMQNTDRAEHLLSEIVVLLNISPSLLAMKRRRLLKKLFDMDGPPSLFDE